MTGYRRKSDGPMLQFISACQSAEEAADDSEKRNENTGCHTEILQLWDGLLDYIMPKAFSISEGHEIVFSMNFRGSFVM